MSQRTGCKTELLFDDGETADVEGWEILNIGDKFMISGGHAAVFKFLLRELSDEERRRREATWRYAGSARVEVLLPTRLGW